jgi:mannose-1-phosphate guanylyltransferase/mannose-1-phosphate guanylyltransferase/mannose-6-phosphate isomerase
MFDDCIIMAGGSGTRLWPASNSRTPKQFLSVNEEGSFFDAALKRGLALTRASGDSASTENGDGRVIIIAGKTHVPHIIRAAEQLSGEDRRRLVLIPEPMARNTAPALACGARYAGLSAQKSSAQKNCVDRNILVLTSDHIIGPMEVFAADARAAAAFSRAGGLAVFGIPPKGPETGYGYIETGNRLGGPSAETAGSGAAAAPGETAVYEVLSFREKPDRARAEQFLAAGNFFWNSGMFAFSSEFILEEFRRNSPETLKPFEALQAPEEAAYRTEAGLRILDNWPGLPAAYEAVKGISFDYAIAEKCTRTVMAAARFDWFDVGSWDEYARLAGNSATEVYYAGTPAAAGCFVDSDIPVALCGVEDLIVVIRSGKDGGPPRALIAKKGETQGVRDIVEQIKAAGRTELL